MTKNRAAKQRRRRAAAAAGTNYTTSLRASRARPSQGGAGQPPSWPGVPADVNGWYPHRLRTDLPWADLVLDARRGYEVANDDLARILPAEGDWLTPGVPSRPGSGLLEISWLPADLSAGSVTVTVHVIAEAEDLRAVPVGRRVNGKPGLLMLVTYPDGFRIGVAALHSANYHDGADEVWDRFLDRATVCGDGLSQFVSSGRGGPIRSTHQYTHDVEVASALVRRGASLLRDAVYDLASWLPRDRYYYDADDSTGCPEIDRLVAATTLGFADQLAYDRLWDHGAEAGWLNEARASGFDTSDSEALAWIEAALPWDFNASAPAESWTDLLGPWQGIARSRVHSIELVREMADAQRMRRATG